jgi:hypothetical protein
MNDESPREIAGSEAPLPSDLNSLSHKEGLLEVKPDDHFSNRTENLAVRQQQQRSTETEPTNELAQTMINEQQQPLSAAADGEADRTQPSVKHSSASEVDVSPDVRERRLQQLRQTKKDL